MDWPKDTQTSSGVMRCGWLRAVAWRGPRLHRIWVLGFRCL